MFPEMVGKTLELNLFMERLNVSDCFRPTTTDEICYLWNRPNCSTKSENFLYSADNLPRIEFCFVFIDRNKVIKQNASNYYCL